MPQLDPTFYPSQIFWLVVTGLALYFIMARVALPRVAAMLELRDTSVQKDLDAAYNLKQQAEDIKIAYTKILRDADDHAQKTMQELTKDIKDRQSASLAQVKAENDGRIKGVEQSLRVEKDALTAQVPELASRLSKNIVAHFAKEAA